MEGSNKRVAQWSQPDTAGAANLMKERATKRHMGGKSQANSVILKARNFSRKILLL